MMRTYFLILLILPLSSGERDEKKDHIYEVLSEESNMSLSGSSNLHDWSCNIKDMSGNAKIDPKALKTWPDNKKAIVEEASIQIPIEKGIKCGKSTMNEKLYKAMKSEEHPRIRYEFKHASVKGEVKPSGFQLKTVGDLRIAGEVKEVSILVSGQRLKEDRYSFSGAYSLNMKDYGIEPPTAMWGSLRTDEEVTVDFLFVVGK